jgi:hypothetical protein
MPRGNIKMSYYLQYGTAVMDRTFDRRIDSTRLEGQGLLKGWRMDFSREGGQPNIVQDPNGEVWGLLFLIEEHKLDELDTAEPGGTRHKGSCLFEWEPVDCYYYSYPSQAGTPNAEFLKNLREVYRQASLPQKQIDRALKPALSAA